MSNFTQISEGIEISESSTVPAGLVNGAIWYSSTLNSFMLYQKGISLPLEPLTSFLSALSAGTNVANLLVAATRVNARYFGSGMYISGALTTVLWLTKDYDTNGPIVNGIYIVPTDVTKLHVDAAILITGNAHHEHRHTDTATIELQVNGIAVKTIIVSARSSHVSLPITDTILVNTGDQVRIQVSTTMCDPSIVPSNSGNVISIVKVG
jgi:hypothetical protein